MLNSAKHALLSSACKNVLIVGIFYFYDQVKFHEKSFLTSELSAIINPQWFSY